MLKQQKEKTNKPKKHLLMQDMNIIGNLMKRKRYLNYNLIGHKKHITALDC